MRTNSWQRDAYRMIRCATKARIKTRIGAPQLPGDRHHGVFEERRTAPNRAVDGQPREQAHDGSV